MFRVNRPLPVIEILHYKVNYLEMCGHFHLVDFYVLFLGCQ